ncbi:MAG: FAD-dependent oxidoreductase, partial [Spirochaetia bacterium]
MGAIGAQQNDLVTRGTQADLGIITASLSLSKSSSQELVRLIVDALQAFEADGAITAIVLSSLSALTPDDKYERRDDADLSEVIGQIEGMTKPVIAALDGPVFDGAFELALACDLRVATPSSVVGFPSLMIGVPPHNGATQRLPRLIGIAQSLDLLSAEKGMLADKTAAGLIDRIGDDIIEMAQSVATSAHKVRFSIRSVAPGDAESERRSLSSFLKRAKGIAAAEGTADLITGSPGYGYEDGLRRELSNHNRFRNSPETAALRHLQRAETLAKSVPGLDGVTPRTIGKAAVVGAGTMGSGIAYSLAASGLPVVVLEQSDEAATVGRERIAALLQAQYRSGRLSDRGLAEMSDRLQVTDLWDAAADVDLVIEAAFEDLDVKA